MAKLERISHRATEGKYRIYIYNYIAGLLFPYPPGVSSTYFRVYVTVDFKKLGRTLLHEELFCDSGRWKFFKTVAQMNLFNVAIRATVLKVKKRKKRKRINAAKMARHGILFVLRGFRDKLMLTITPLGFYL